MNAKLGIRSATYFSCVGLRNFLRRIRSVPGAVATGSQVSLLDCREMLRSMWNDTDTPLAYLITFRSYGTWLHGDERGSIDRFHNRYKSPYIEPNPRWQLHNTRVLDGEPVILNAAQRKSVERAIHTTCEYRRWHLHVLNVRTTDAHIVVCIGSLKPE